MFKSTQKPGDAGASPKGKKKAAEAKPVGKQMTSAAMGKQAAVGHPKVDSNKGGEAMPSKRPDMSHHLGKYLHPKKKGKK